MNGSPASEPDLQRYTAVVMAGSRGIEDPVASAAGVSHKCLVDVCGKPMLDRVLDTLAASPRVARCVLCIEPEFDAPAFVNDRIASGWLSRLDAAQSPAASATRACDALADAMPLLVVTGDHPLLDAEMLDYFCSRAPLAGDIAAALAPADVVLERYPGSRRTLLRFADGPFCGCNLFALNTPAAGAATRFWVGIETQRKKPWRLVRMLGPRVLVAYLSGRLSLPRAMHALSAELGIRAGAVTLPFAEAAIDVDKPADLTLVRSILQSGS